MPACRSHSAFFYSVFQGYAPDTDLDNVRNRVVGILFGLIVTAFVFHYIWPEGTRKEISRVPMKSPPFLSKVWLLLPCDGQRLRVRAL